jgi:beta-galactosidase
VLDPQALRDVVAEAAAEAGVAVQVTSAGLEVIARSDAEHTYTFLINHSDDEHKYPAPGYELIAGEEVSTAVVIPAGTVRVVRRFSSAPPTTGRITGLKDDESD